MTDLTNSEILGRSDADWDQTQEEINIESLLYHDQREFLEKISDKDLSKYEFRFLLDKIQNSNRSFWSLVLMETIKVFNLNTLKIFMKNDTVPSRIVNIKLLLTFLKDTLPEVLTESRLPRERKDLIEFIKNLNVPNFLIFALETIDNEDLDRFLNYFVN